MSLLSRGCVSGLILPIRMWEVAVSVLPGVVLGMSLFIPWPWPWQTSFALLAFFTEYMTLRLIPDSALPAPFVDEGALVLLFSAGLASVIGSRSAGEERRRVAESEARRFKALFVGAGDPIAALEPDGRVRDANPRLLALLGKSLDDVRGKLLAHLLAPGRGDGWLLAPLEAATQGSVSHLERIRRVDGSELELEVTLARVDMPTGPLVQVILHDRTERRALERRQVQNERLDGLARFAGGIAHQFNNLLGGVMTHASLLRTEANEAGVAAVDEILAAARRGRDLTKELLRFTKAGELQLRTTPAQEILDRVTLLARAALPESVQLTVEADPGLPALQADPDQLSHAIYQLVLNARDAMRDQPSGRITIAAGRENIERDPRWPDAAPGSNDRISVNDTGVGMDTATRRAGARALLQHQAHAPGRGAGSRRRVRRGARPPGVDSHLQRPRPRHHGGAPHPPEHRARHARARRDPHPPFPRHLLHRPRGWSSWWWMMKPLCGRRSSGR